LAEIPTSKWCQQRHGGKSKNAATRAVAALCQKNELMAAVTVVPIVAPVSTTAAAIAAIAAIAASASVAAITGAAAGAVRG